jgi:hypothetical protein
MEELLYPNLLDQKTTLTNQFEGMSNEPFSYEDFEKAREKLIETIHGSLTEHDKAFLISVQSLQPDWSIYDFERFPSVQWKLQNLERLKETNADKYKGQLDGLIEKLTS